MNLEQLTNIVNDIFYNNSSSYKVIESKQKELLSIIGADTDIKKIDDKIINKYLKILRDKNNKPATINSKMVYLSKNLRYAQRIGQLKKIPYIPTFKIIAKKDIILSIEDIKKMSEYALNNNLIELYQVIIIGYNTGMRISNILTINPDEDIKDNYIRIYHNKTNKPYSVPLNDTLKDLFNNNFKPFTMNYRQIQYQFETMIKKLNMNKNITIHTLRHSTCSKLVASGVPLPVVQALMNHKNLSTTMRYNHLKNTQLEDAVSML